MSASIIPRVRFYWLIAGTRIYVTACVTYIKPIDLMSTFDSVDLSFPFSMLRQHYKALTVIVSIVSTRISIVERC